MWVIYGHQNKVNNKWYIGQTQRDPETRWGKNGINYLGYRFYSAIKKYGWDGFNHIILIKDITTQEEADKLEVETIKKYDSVLNGYNVAYGGGVVNLRPVYQLDENKTILNKFSSISAAEDVCSIYNIGACCFKRQKTAGGYYWCFQEDYESYKIIKPKTCPKPERVYRIDENKNILESFNSLREAETKYELNHSNFVACLSMLRHCCNNMFWCYEKNYADYKIKTKIVYKNKIDQFDLSGKFIKTWDSARQIEDAFGYAHSSILDCCKNKIKQSHQFIWRYSNEN